MIKTVPSGFTLRAPQPEEVSAVGQLYEVYDTHYFGKADYSTEDVQGDWEHLNLETDAWIVTTPDGKVVGYGQGNDKGGARFEGVFLVHPDYFDQGIEECLIEKFVESSKEQARAAGFDTCKIALHADGAIEREKKYILQFEMNPTFYWLQLAVEMTEEPLAVVWPEGLTVRTVETEADIRAVYEARLEIFKDQRDGETMTAYEQFAEYWMSPSMDKSLQWMVLQDDEVVAFNLCGLRTGMGKITVLGVKEKMRGQGLGLALLHHAFGEFYRRGLNKVMVTVDGENSSGATRLYRRAGMEQFKEYIRFEKTLPTT